MKKSGYVVYLTEGRDSFYGCSSIHRCIVREKCKAHDSHLLVAFGFVDFTKPFNFARHVWIVVYIELKLM